MIIRIQDHENNQPVDLDFYRTSFNANLDLAAADGSHDIGVTLEIIGGVLQVLIYTEESLDNGGEPVIVEITRNVPALIERLKTMES